MYKTTINYTVFYMCIFKTNSLTFCVHLNFCYCAVYDPIKLLKLLCHFYVVSYFQRPRS